MFPQAIALAATFDVERVRAVADAIADEARAKHHEYLRQGDHGMYKGLTFWSPNINIFRDPRWGRGHETYGECPFLTARLGVVYLPRAAGRRPQASEAGRHAQALRRAQRPRGAAPQLRRGRRRKGPARDLPAGLPRLRDRGRRRQRDDRLQPGQRRACSASPTLLEKILRDEWGFDGYVVSDCWAIQDLHDRPRRDRLAGRVGGAGGQGRLRPQLRLHLRADPGGGRRRGCWPRPTSTAACGGFFGRACASGMFDPPARVAHAAIPYEVNDSDAHRALARADGRRRRWCCSRTTASCLPLGKDLRSIAVIGPNADDREVLLGNYFGEPSRFVTPLRGDPRRGLAARPRSGTRRAASASAPRPTASAAPATSRRR